MAGLIGASICAACGSVSNVGVFAFAAVSEASVVMFNGMLVLPTGGTGTGIEVLRRADKLLETPLDDFVVFPLGTDVGEDVVVAPLGEITIILPQCGQKCTTVSKRVPHFLHFSELHAFS